MHAFFSVSLRLQHHRSAGKKYERKKSDWGRIFSLSRISTTNPKTGLPEIRTLIVSGKLQTILKDANLLSYTRNRSASVFNAESITEQEQLTLSLPPGQRMADTLAQLSALMAEKKSISGE